MSEGSGKRRIRSTSNARVEPVPPEAEAKIMHVVASKMTPEDRDPEVVIKTSYRGNKQRWLRDMAQQHGVKLTP